MTPAAPAFSQGNARSARVRAYKQQAANGEAPKHGPGECAGLRTRLPAWGTDWLILADGWTQGDAASTIFRDFGFAGVAARGLVHGPPGGSFHLLAARGVISGKPTAPQRLAGSEGEARLSEYRPHSAASALPPYRQPGSGGANYGPKAAAGVTLFPNVQMVGRASAAQSVRNAWYREPSGSEFLVAGHWSCLDRF